MEVIYAEKIVYFQNITFEREYNTVIRQNWSKTLNE